MKTILVALDFSPMTPAVVDVARQMARGLSASLLLVHVEAPEPDFVGYGPGPQHERDAVARDIRRHHKELDELTETLRGEGLAADARLVSGPTVEKIIEEAGEHGADLIVVGCRGHRPLLQMLLGSVSEGVLRRAHCPVVMVPTRRSG